MGFYLNPGNDGYRKSIRSKIYVDKAGLNVSIRKKIHLREPAAPLMTCAPSSQKTMY